MELSIKYLNEQASSIYKSNDEQMQRMDSGYDLYYCGEDVVVKPYNDVSDNSELLYNKPTMLGLGIACEPNGVFGYYLHPRSSISKTPLLMANSVGIIDYGKIQIVDTPESMKNKLETDMITFSIIPDENKQAQFINKIKSFELTKNVEINGNNMVVQSSNSTQVIPKIFQASSEFGISIDSFVLNKPTLDDVFISYTGHNLRDDTTGKFNKRKEFNQSRRRAL